jgi:hypothetical protein
MLGKRRAYAYSKPAGYSYRQSSRGVTISHREYLGDISSSASFAVTAYNFNPGLQASFPWLCNVAANFTEYSVNHASLQFISTSADALNSTNTALGTIILVADYNVANQNFTTKQQIENSNLGISGKPSSDLVMPINVSKRHNVNNRFYIRSGNVPTGSDPHLYDLCKLQIATVGSQAAAVIGEIWIEYSISFSCPILIGSLAAPRIQYAHYRQTVFTNARPLNGSTSAGTLTKIDDSFGLSFNDTQIVFPAGCVTTPVMVQLVWYGSGAGVDGIQPSLTVVNGAGYDILIGNSQHDLDLDYGTSVQKLCSTSYWDLTDNTESRLTLGTTGTLPVGTQSLDIIIIGLSLESN